LSDEYLFIKFQSYLCTLSVLGGEIGEMVILTGKWHISATSFSFFRRFSVARDCGHIVNSHFPEILDPPLWFVEYIP